MATPGALTSHTWTTQVSQMAYEAPAATGHGQVTPGGSRGMPCKSQGCSLYVALPLISFNLPLCLELTLMPLCHRKLDFQYAQTYFCLTSVSLLRFHSTHFLSTHPPVSQNIFLPTHLPLHSHTCLYPIPFPDTSALQLSLPNTCLFPTHLGYKSVIQRPAVQAGRMVGKR